MTTKQFVLLLSKRSIGSRSYRSDGSSVIHFTDKFAENLQVSESAYLCSGKGNDYGKTD